TLSPTLSRQREREIDILFQLKKTMAATKPIIAISSCLLGQRVRYDGEIKSFVDITQHLQQYFDLLPVCPEVEIGLGVPRPAVQLTGNPSHPRMTGRDNPEIDVTTAMRVYCATKPQQLTNICGYAFKSKSPSCGLKNIPVVNNGIVIDDNQRGLFAQRITMLWPDLPVCDENDLLTAESRQKFITQVLAYKKQCNM
ncbi:MAG TPA: DUF523 domain-containing protein, partial [Gammaproteobacteria bacterium]|nr:DUF523 domain-containing protein [Gammaproteobacteria bacterium]